MAALIDIVSFKKHTFVDRAHGFSNHFSDNGIFGMSIEGAGSHSSQLLGLTLETLNGLKNKVSDEDLSLVKNQLKMNILKNIE